MECDLAVLPRTSDLSSVNGTAENDGFTWLRKALKRDRTLTFKKTNAYSSNCSARTHVRNYSKSPPHALSSGLVRPGIESQPHPGNKGPLSAVVELLIFPSLNWSAAPLVSVLCKSSWYLGELLGRLSDIPHSGIRLTRIHDGITGEWGKPRGGRYSLAVKSPVAGATIDRGCSGYETVQDIRVFCAKDLILHDKTRDIMFV